MAFLDPVFNPFLGPLVNWSPFWGIFVLALFISLLITLAYKYLTNQQEMKRLKEQQKEFQVKMKGLRDKPDALMRVQKEAMAQNFQYMKHSFKATLITMLPILLIFGWMAAHLSYEPIYPGETYGVTAQLVGGVGQAQLIADNGTEVLSPALQNTTDNKVVWKLKSSAGGHLLAVKAGTTEQSKTVLIGTELNSEAAVSVFQHSDVEQISIDYAKLRPLGPNFTVPLFGWQPGWLGIYIILSLVFSLVLRKLLQVY